MSLLQEAEKLLKSMTKSEKVQLLQWVVMDLGETFPGIETQTGVAGGQACIAKTRIPVWLLEEARRQGARDADILQAYPTLRAEDLANAWAYARAHSEDIEQQIAQNQGI